MLDYCLFGVCCGGSGGIELNIDAWPFFDSLWEMRNCEESLLSLLNFRVLLILRKAAPVIRWAVSEFIKNKKKKIKKSVPLRS